MSIQISHLRSFLAIERYRNFTLAAKSLDLSQSTISQHIQKLESSLGDRVIERDTHQLRLTLRGEALLPYARRMVEMEREIGDLFHEKRTIGTLRLGVSEDVASMRLAPLLREFREQYPDVQLILSVALSRDLFEQQDKGEIDIVLAKRRLGEGRGTVIGRDRLVWLARDVQQVTSVQPLPLIVFPSPSITREILIESLDQVQVPWTIACTSHSLTGLVAAAKAGMGVIVQPENFAPHDLKPVSFQVLPRLEDIEFIFSVGKQADKTLVSLFLQGIEDRLALSIPPKQA